MNDWTLTVGCILGIVCIFGLSGCGSIPTSGQRVDIPPHFFSDRVDSVYIFTSGQRGKAMADQSEKLIFLSALDAAGKSVSVVKTGCYCGSFDWTYDWDSSDILTVVFYERSRKDWKKEGDIFTWKIKIAASGSLLELERTERSKS